MRSRPTIALLGSLITAPIGSTMAAEITLAEGPESSFGYRVTETGGGHDEANPRVETKVVALTDTIRGQRVSKDELPELRAALHEAARAECERLRRRVGSCLIRSVDISEYEDALNPGAFFVRARVYLMWLNRGTAETTRIKFAPVSPIRATA